MSAMNPKTIALSLSSFIVGAYAFMKTQQLSAPMFEPIMEVCSDSSIPAEEFASRTGYHPYEPSVGLGMGTFVCLITQFLHKLTQNYPAGLLTWGGTMLGALPASVLMVLEAGRTGVAGPIRYPIVIGLLGQILGISVVFPAIWVPAYCFGHGTGSVATTRIVASLPLSLPFVVLTVLLFSLDVDSYWWRFCAGVLGGPIITLTSAFLWGVGPPSDENAEVAKKSSHYGSLAYSVAGGIALLGWAYLLTVAWIEYGTDVRTLCSDLWTNADPSVAFMTVDTVGLWLGVIFLIAFRSGSGAIEACLWTPLLGPGAACSLILAGLERKSHLVQVPPAAAGQKSKPE